MVSMNCPKPSDRNKGHSRASEPLYRGISADSGNMPTASQESVVFSQKRKLDEARYKYPPDPLKSVLKYFPGVPYCISDQSGEVWHRIARIMLRFCRVNSIRGAM